VAEDRKPRHQTKSRSRPKFIPADPDSPDKNVKLPRQVRVAAEYAEARIEGRPPRPVESDVPSITNAQINAVLERLERGELVISDRDPGVVIALIREGARRIKTDRQNAQALKARVTRKAQEAKEAREAAIEQRLKFLIQAVSDLSPERAKHLTGEKSTKRLLTSVNKKMDAWWRRRNFGTARRHDPVTKATLLRDIGLLSPLLRKMAGRKKTLRWETPEQARYRRKVEAMRDRFERAALRFDQDLRHLNPKCNACIPFNPFNEAHTPDYWAPNAEL
jgi:hypothetical protein